MARLAPDLLANYTLEARPTGGHLRILACAANDNQGLGDLTPTTEGAAAVGSNPALNLTTMFTPDTVGNVTAVVDPRGNATTTQYDAMRRKVGEQNRDGGVGAVPLMAKAFVYDLNGRLIEEDRATSFDAGGAVTGWQDWLTSHAPIGKVAVATDPLGNETPILYDALDRPMQVTDASGKVTGKTYDPAGQELTEVRGIGSGVQQNTATYSWWPDGQKRAVIDANGNRIGLAYDGFNRLASITHPDNRTELSQYDPDGDLTIWTNRGGFSIVRCYDVLNRKVSEEGGTNAANAGACPTGGTVNLNTRPWDMRARSTSQDSRAAARRNRMLGEWAAGLMGVENVGDYAAAVMRADFKQPGDNRLAFANAGGALEPA